MIKPNGMFKFFKNKVTDNPDIVNEPLLKEFARNRPSKKEHPLCQAPFTSMLFIQSGDIKTCHYNRGYTLGHYPESSIHDIWFGEPLKKLKEHIINCNLSLGCHDCQKNLFKRNFYSVGAARYDYLAEYEKAHDFPVMMDFQLHNKCNLECYMCSGEYSSSIRAHRDHEPPLPEPWDSNFVDQLEEFIPHIKAASFTGGEPFLIDTYYDIWEKFIAQNPNINIFISTNASVLPDRFIKIMDQLKFNFTVSIDSVEKSTYEFIRKNASFETTMDNIKKLHDYCLKNKRHFAIKSCVIKQNAHEFPAFYDYWNERDIMLYPKAVVFPPYAAVKNLPAEELGCLIEKYKAHTIKENTVTQKNNSLYFSSLVTQIDGWYQEALDRGPEISISDRSLEELKQLVSDRISGFVEKDMSNDIITKNKKNNFYKNLLDQIYADIKDEMLLKKSLLFMTEFPIENLISELDRNSVENLKIRFKQAGI